MSKEAIEQKEVIVGKLKDSGCRITKQRLILLDVILEGECRSCKEITSFCSIASFDIHPPIVTDANRCNLSDRISFF